MTRNEQKIALFAFWPYDAFPFVLGSEATKMNDEGRVYVPAYQGWVSPTKLVPVKTGREIKKSLDVLVTKKREAQKELDEEFDGRARALISMERIS